jgi:hypothetical protein
VSSTAHFAAGNLKATILTVIIITILILILIIIGIIIKTIIIILVVIFQFGNSRGRRIWSGGGIGEGGGLGLPHGGEGMGQARFGGSGADGWAGVQ